MSETAETALYEATWAAEDETLLRLAVAALAPHGIAASPILQVEWAGTRSFAVRLASTAPLPAPPAGVRAELAPAAGVFMPPPRHPTPLEWMDRLPPERQQAVLEALEQTPRGRWFRSRLLAAREIDTRREEVREGIALLRQAGALSAEEADRLLA